MSITNELNRILDDLNNVEKICKNEEVSTSDLSWGVTRARVNQAIIDIRSSLQSVPKNDNP